MKDQPTSISSPASADLLLPLLGLDSALSPSAKSTRIAKKSSKRGSVRLMPTLRANDSEKRGNVADDPRNGLTGFVQHRTKLLRTLKASDAEKQGRKNLPHQVEHGYTGTFSDWTDDHTEAFPCLQLEFPASQPARPGNAEAEATTVGSGQRLFESLVKPARLSPCSKTLLESLLLSKVWSSKICFLQWKATATKFSRRLSFQLVPSEPVTDAIESSLLPTLSATEMDGSSEMEPCRQGGMKLRDMLPTLSAWDWKSEKSNMHGQNSRPLSEVVGLIPTLRANKRGVPDSHGNATAWSGLKLTSAFCERFMGFPKGWTEIEEPESTRSATRSCQRKPTQSSKPSEKRSKT